VYPKKSSTNEELEALIVKFENYSPALFNSTLNSDEILESSDSESENEGDNSDNDNTNDELVNTNYNSGRSYNKQKNKVKDYKKEVTLIELIKDNNCEYNTKLIKLTEAFANLNFPTLEGDNITFIGLSFINYTEEKPYKRVIIVKGGCKIPDKYLLWAQENNVIVLERTTEKELLLTFTKIINSENPHIITGYNITGFDFEFMYNRSKELNCVNEFLKLSRNKNEVCISNDWRAEYRDKLSKNKTGAKQHDTNSDTKDKYKSIETNKIVLASGEYNLKFIKMYTFCVPKCKIGSLLLQHQLTVIVIDSK
jgi:DNA polymerase elongation subunit (family B)